MQSLNPCETVILQRFAIPLMKNELARKNTNREVKKQVLFITYRRGSSTWADYDLLLAYSLSIFLEAQKNILFNEMEGKTMDNLPHVRRQSIPQVMGLYKWPHCLKGWGWMDQNGPETTVHCRKWESRSSQMSSIPSWCESVCHFLLTGGRGKRREGQFAFHWHFLFVFRSFLCHPSCTFASIAEWNSTKYFFVKTRAWANLHLSLNFWSLWPVLIAVLKSPKLRYHQAPMVHASELPSSHEHGYHRYY